MRNYWIKIALGALAVFAVGMVIVTGIRKTKAKFTNTLESTDPISLPIAFLPFRLEGTKLGSLDKVVLLRDQPNQVSGVRVVVDLADSVHAEKFQNCLLVVDDVEHINEKSSFRCEKGDTTGARLAQFGYVHFKNTGDSVALLLPAHSVEELKKVRFNLNNHGFSITSADDSLADAVESRMDARSDSVDELRDLADQFEDSAAQAPQAQRPKLQRKADSVRIVMRAMVDRMKADETQLDALRNHGGTDFSDPDSAAAYGKRIADSVKREVDRELRRKGVTKVSPTPTPSPPTPPN
ncbi:MAG TPA: hypothetical protein VH438_02660 [Gemmatimonadales bacterium]|jgi:hypothetical protein